MHRFRFYTAILCAGLFVIALGGWLYRHLPEPLPVVRLGDGSELRLRDVGWKGKPAIAFEPLLWSAFKRVVPTRWRAVIGEPIGMLWHPEEHGMTLGFTWVRTTSKSGMRCLLWNLGGDGTETPVSSASLSGGDQVIVAYQFSQISWRDERLRFRLRDGTNNLEFSLPNPRRGEVFPQWTSEPLPQTRERDGFEFTLDSLKPVENAGTDRQPVWTPEVRIRRAGEDVTGWFVLGHEFADPTGNRSTKRLAAMESVWQVRVTAHPSGAFPFAESEVALRHTGPVPGPGELIGLPLPAGEAGEGLQAVWLTGPGRFEIRAGTVMPVRPSAEPFRKRFDSSPRGGVRFESGQPQLCWRSEATVAGESDEPPCYWKARVRRADGRTVDLEMNDPPTGEYIRVERLPNQTGFRRSQLCRWELPAEVAGEPFTVEVVRLLPRRMEFTVTAPTGPKAVPAP